MKRILVVDDEHQIRDLLSAMLSREGYEVDTADDGDQALNYLTRKQVDLVVTDLIMPNKEGLETIQEVRGKHPDLPIIAISGGGRFNPSEILPLAKLLGARRIIQKPFSRMEIVSAVEEVFTASA